MLYPILCYNGPLYNGARLCCPVITSFLQIHLDGCPLLTQASLVYLKKCPDIVHITMIGTSVTMKPDMESVIVKMDGCPLIPIS